MKLFLLTAFISTSAFAQVEMTTKNGSCQFQKVIELPGKTAPDLYKASLKWISVTYKNPSAVTTSTIENDLITGKGSAEVPMPGIVPISTPYRYVFRIDVKEGKARITIDGVVIGLSPSYTLETYVLKNDGSIRSGSQAQGLKAGVTEDANGIISSFEQHVLGNSTAKDDW